MNAAGYYTTLSADQFIAGRATQVATIVRDIKPDLLNVGSEPDTEYRLTGQAFLRSPTSFAGMVRTFTEQLAAAGLTEVPIVAGSGTWMYQADSYVDALCAIDGLWGIDLHLYPVNLNFLDQALALADLAHAHGKHVTMLEAWLQKERDSELSTMDPAVDPTVYARDTYSFWAPLDQEFLALLAKLAQVERMDYVSPFWSRYFFAYLDYDMVMQTSPPLTAAQVVTLATTAEAQALVAGEYTSTGLAYGALVSGRLVHRHLRH